MKKSTLVFIALLIGGTFYVIGEGQQEKTSQAEYKLNTPGQWPVIVSEIPYDFDAIGTYASHYSSGGLQDAALTEYLENITNVRINWIEVIVQSMWVERQNLILASGDLPDIFMSPFGMRAQQVYSLGLNGTLIRLNDLINEKMPDFKRELERYPQYKAELTMPDGNIYALANLEGGCYHCTMPAKMWVYKPWIDKLALKWPPETTEDFYEMLKAFKTRDPNGNGQSDEVPFSGSPKAWEAYPLEFIMNSFVYTQRGVYGGFLGRNGEELSFVADTDEWRDGLRYLNRLVDEGLLAPESFVQTHQMLLSQAESPGAPKIGAVGAGNYGVFTQNGGETGRFAEYQPIAPLQGPGGVRFSRYTPAGISYHGRITNKADRPDIIAQWANWFYQDWIVHSQLAWGFRREGVEWRYLTDEEKQLGLVTRDGRPALTMPLSSEIRIFGIDKNEEGWFRSAPNWAPYAIRALPLEWRDDPTKQEYRLMAATRDLMEPYKPEGKHMPPNLVFPEDVIDEITDLNEAIASETGIVEVWSAEFILGVKDIESDVDWNAYLDQLSRAGKDRYVELWTDVLASN
jgi:putative aldouronate transport system substrate-binding protein